MNRRHVSPPGAPRPSRTARVVGGLLAVTVSAGVVSAGVVSAGVVSVAVLAAGSSISVIGTGGAVASASAVRLAPPVVHVAHFATLPVGAALPDDAACAAMVRPAAENRHSNDAPNHTVGIGPTAGAARVTGDFTGTTDELLQWVACKWGIDEDVVRAQIAKESWWRQDAEGDLTGDQSVCAPPLRTSTSTCPESVGLGQVRYQYHSAAFANDNAIRSSASNLDYTYSVWRTCFEGGYDWLNTVERGRDYAAGDMWGCIGVWFSGRWYTPGAVGYIAAVQEYEARRIWETPDFQNG